MPIGEIAGELLGGVFKVIGRAIAEVIIEIFIKGIGYLICRPFSRSVNPDGLLVVSVGVFFWVIIFVSLYIAYEFISFHVEVDRCLDSGGSYNYSTGECIKT